MPTFFSQLRNVKWTAVLAVFAGSASMVIGAAGGDVAQVVGFGVYGLILATLAQKS